MSTFRFKQFDILQDKTAMKVGTDGVLLGAWSDVVNSNSVLDIGTGTGVISLMIAQRSSAKITPIEIEENAYFQAKQNFEKSKWIDRFEVYHTSLQNFKPEHKFDTIVSNPPFFNNSQKTPNESRNFARHTDSLSFDELLKFTSENLSDIGKASFIIPYDSENQFLVIAKDNKLFANRICRVKGKEDSPIKRSLIELSFQNNKCDVNYLTIEISRHVYTQDYINLTKDFYLKM
jgi:tRNA1Val (adenine37-N6)-methyltransferase